MLLIIYALLVGINNYKSDEIRPLNGCINDIDEIANCLLTLSGSNENISIKKLIDCQATRQAIINGFKEHLCQANRDDIVVFYFSGHGSQEPVPPQWREIEANGLVETLVCYDSRTENSWDLADKELGVLINQVAQKNPQIIIILDCCHSGGALRDERINNSLQPRYIEKSEARSFSNFLDSEVISTLFSKYDFRRDEELSFFVPEGRYIFLSACRDVEKAFERLDIQRGVFSFFLTDTLKQTNGNLSYQDLFNKIRDKVNDFDSRQCPQFEVSNSIYADFIFLGNSVIKREHYIVTNHVDKGWVIDAGGLHGILPPHKEEKTMLAIFPLSLENNFELDSAIAFAEVIQIFSSYSQINLTETRKELDSNLTYKSILLNSMLLHPLKLYFEGEKEGINLLRTTLHNWDCNQEAFIKEVSQLEKGDLKLIACNNSYLISQPNRDNFFLIKINAYTFESCLQIIKFLEHIKKWFKILNLANDPNNLIPQDAVKLTFYKENYEQISLNNLRLKYKYKNDKWCPPKIHIEITNTSEIKLYCALLNLTQLYKIKAFPLRDKNQVVDLNPQEKLKIFEGRAIAVSIPDKLDRQGVCEYKDILKLMVSNKPFDVSLLEQSNIGETVRAMKINSNPKIIRDSWITKNFIITTIKPKISSSVDLDRSVAKGRNANNTINYQINKKKKHQVVLIIVGVLVFLSLISIGLFMGRKSPPQNFNQIEQSKVK